MDPTLYSYHFVAKHKLLQKPVCDKTPPASTETKGGWPADLGDPAYETQTPNKITLISTKLRSPSWQVRFTPLIILNFVSDPQL